MLIQETIVYLWLLPVVANIVLPLLILLAYGAGRFSYYLFSALSSGRQLKTG
jgi:hypothetical protein